MIKTFLYSHHTELLLAAGWLFSLWCSTMPTPKPNASPYIIWAHDFLQAIAANMNKRSATITTTTPDGKTETAHVEGPPPTPIIQTGQTPPANP